MMSCLPFSLNTNAYYVDLLERSTFVFWCYKISAICMLQLLYSYSIYFSVSTKKYFIFSFTEKGLPETATPLKQNLMFEK